MIISDQSMCQKGRFSKIRSHIKQLSCKKRMQPPGGHKCEIQGSGQGRRLMIKIFNSDNSGEFGAETWRQIHLNLPELSLLKNILPSQPFLGHHLGFHIFFHNCFFGGHTFF